ncbi:MAG: hypothetical protein LBE48_00385 [Methanomassiliicoccaceae archaeon]|jgi:hypothetical protein|nr:hypothetical protein [Methanomassiliicoccaceae archaeon]
MNPAGVKERRIALAILIITQVSMAAMFSYVTLGYAPGLKGEHGHPMIYLQLTCFLWAVVMLVIPVLRLLRKVSLPLWFTVILYADMYMYVISLCIGMYKDDGIYWWANFTHVISTVVVASVVFLALCKMAERCPPHLSFGSKGGVIALMMLISAGFGAIWELMEGLTDLIGGYSYMIYGAIDALGNMGADAVGVLIMAAIALIILRKHDARYIGSKVRLGKNIDAGE